MGYPRGGSLPWSHTVWRSYLHGIRGECSIWSFMVCRLSCQDSFDFTNLITTIVHSFAGRIVEYGTQPVFSSMSPTTHEYLHFYIPMSRLVCEVDGWNWNQHTNHGMLFIIVLWSLSPWSPVANWFIEHLLPSSRSTPSECLTSPFVLNLMNTTKFRCSCVQRFRPNQADAPTVFLLFTANTSNREQDNGVAARWGGIEQKGRGNQS